MLGIMTSQFVSVGCIGSEWGRISDEAHRRYEVAVVVFDEEHELSVDIERHAHLLLTSQVDAIDTI